MREIDQIIKGMAASDGDGVNMIRVIGTPQLNVLDPFLLLDAFGSDKPQDYIGGFPSHPHRGFETVTYILNGRMRHKDNAGHEGIIGEGDVQWMSAGRGIVHSEMPEQQDGLLKGFQLWINLPAAEKMSEPRYQEHPTQDIPVEKSESGTLIKVIAGTTDLGTKGPIDAPATLPIYMDVTLQANDSLSQFIPEGNNAFVYGIEGKIAIGDKKSQLGIEEIAILTDGSSVTVNTGDAPARVLIIAGKPLNEPIARGGPFVMNTKAEVLQAFQDFHEGRF